MKRLFLTAVLLCVGLTIWALDWSFPLADYSISSSFGFRNDVALGGGELTVHLGIDMVPNIFAKSPKANVQVHCIAHGDVLIVYPPPGAIGYRKDGSKFTYKGHPTFGGMVVVKHWDDQNKMNVYSIYGHMKETWVREGDTINKNEALGLVGSTGQSTGPHLHWSLMYDPLDLIKKLMSGGNKWF